MKVVLLCFIILFLNGCGMKKFVVEHADFWIYHETSKRLPVHSNQKKEVYGGIRAFLNDSKTSALQLQSIMSDINLKDEIGLEKKYLQLEAVYLHLMKDFTKIITQQILKLDAKQQINFLEKIKNDNDKILNQKKDEKIKTVETRLKKIFGEVQDEQKKLIAEFTEYFHEREKKRSQRREELYQTLKDIFEENAPESLKKQKVEKCFQDFQSQILPENRNLEFIKKLSPTLTTKQLGHFSVHMEDIKEILNLYLKTQYKN